MFSSGASLPGSSIPISSYYPRLTQPRRPAGVTARYEPRPISSRGPALARCVDDHAPPSAGSVVHGLLVASLHRRRRRLPAGRGAGAHPGRGPHTGPARPSRRPVQGSRHSRVRAAARSIALDPRSALRLPSASAAPALPAAGSCSKLQFRPGYRRRRARRQEFGSPWVVAEFRSGWEGLAELSPVAAHRRRPRRPRRGYGAPACPPTDRRGASDGPCRLCSVGHRAGSLVHAVVLHERPSRLSGIRTPQC